MFDELTLHHAERMTGKPNLRLLNDLSNLCNDYWKTGIERQARTPVSHWRRDNISHEKTFETKIKLIEQKHFLLYEERHVVRKFLHRLSFSRTQFKTRVLIREERDEVYRMCDFSPSMAMYSERLFAGAKIDIDDMKNPRRWNYYRHLIHWESPEERQAKKKEKELREKKWRIYCKNTGQDYYKNLCTRITEDPPNYKKPKPQTLKQRIEIYDKKHPGKEYHTLHEKDKKWLTNYL
jgi:hypothetical protein